MYDEIGAPVDSSRVAGVGRETAKGALWFGGATIANQTLALINNAVVCRFVLPAEYGNVAMAMVVVYLTGLFVDFGVTPAIVAGRIKDPKAVISCHWVICLFGLLMGILSLALSPVAAHFFGNRRVIPLLAAASLLLVINAWRAVPQAVLEAAGHFGRVAVVSTLTQAAACATGITIALLGGREWAVLGPSLTVAVVGTLATIAVSPMRIRPVFSWIHLKPHIAEGSHLMSYSITDYVFNTSDQVVVGRILGAYPLGIYNFSGNLVTRSLGMVTGMINSPLMSALGRTEKKPEAVNRTAVRAGVGISRITFPLAAGGILVAPQLIRTLAGPHWVQCSDLVRILFFMGAFQSLISLAVAIWLTMGHSRLVMLWGVTSNIFVLGAFIAGACIGRSAKAVAMAYMLYSVCLLTPLCLYLTRSWCKIPLKGLGTGLLRILPDVAVMSVAVWTVGALMARASLPAPIVLLAQVAVGMVTYVFCFRLWNAAEMKMVLSAMPAKIRGPATRLLRFSRTQAAS
jgi:O-antigen/teichoic acid export membrane protein